MSELRKGHMVLSNVVEAWRVLAERWEGDLVREKALLSLLPDAEALERVVALAAREFEQGGEHVYKKTAEVLAAGAVTLGGGDADGERR